LEPLGLQEVLDQLALRGQLELLEQLEKWETPGLQEARAGLEPRVLMGQLASPDHVELWEIEAMLGQWVRMVRPVLPDLPDTLG